MFLNLIPAIETYLGFIQKVCHSQNCPHVTLGQKVTNYVMKQKNFIQVLKLQF